MFGLIEITPFLFGLACLVGILAGIVKGVVGFAMPMILVSGLGTFFPPELALAGIIMPTVVTNVSQAFRNGARAAWDTIVKFRRFLMIVGVFLVSSAQLVNSIPSQIYLGTLGCIILLFALAQLFDLFPRFEEGNKKVETIAAMIGGILGGLSGTWGPPTVIYLTAMNVAKSDSFRIQGVVYGLGSLALVFAHMASGILTVQTASFSAVLVIPAMIGFWIGGRLSDKVDQAGFKRLTLIVLIIAALNLIRRAVFG